MSAGPGLGSPGAAVVEQCEEGETRACGKTLTIEAEVMTCFRGTQTCDSGRWGECDDGTITEEAVPSQSVSRGEREALSLSAPAACDDPSTSFYNPCDPGCMYFDEDPPDLTGNPSTPPAPPTYNGNPSRPLCTADVCTASPAPLTYGCSPCVTAVCDTDMDCCTTAWDDACVESALNICAGIPRGPGLCDFGLFSDGNIVTANRPASNSLIGAYGNVVVGTDANINGGGIRAAGNIQFNSLNDRDIDAAQGIFADGAISSQDSSTTLTGDMAAGGGIFLPSWELRAGYSVSAAGNIDGLNGSTSYGHLASAGAISSFNVNGTSCQGSSACYTHTPVQLPEQTGGSAIPVLSTNCGGTGTYSANGGTVDVPGPGAYRAVDVINDGSVRLVGEGTYYFDTWELDGGELILEPDMGGTVGWDIRVCGNVNFHNGTKVTGGTGLTNDSNNVLLDNTLLSFYADTSNTITMGTSVYWSGIFMAPNGTVEKADVNSPPSEAAILAGTRAAPINGAIWASSLSIGTNARTYQISSSDCEALGIPGTVGTTSFSGPCPVSNTLEATGPALASPCVTGADCQMNHRCVEPETDASCAHSKCATGLALADTCDPCVADICAADPTCCSGAWDASCVAMVSSVCDAVCGNTSPEAATCTNNSVDGFKENCSGYDLALGVPCDDEIEVCNHGDTSFDGDIEVGYYADSQNQLGLADPLFSPDGICTGTDLYIGPGRCATISCPVPAGTYTLMADPAGLLSECDGRRSDNWSVDDDRICTNLNTTTRLEVEDFSGYSNPVAGGSDGGFGGDLGWDNCSGGVCSTIGWTNAGDYIEWTYEAPTYGVYGFDVQLASDRDGWDMSIWVDGVRMTINTGNSTGGLWSYRTIRMGSVNMTPGTHTVRLEFNTWGQNIDFVDVITPTPPNNAQNTVTELYEAVCPSGTSGRWGLLAWQSDAPGASEITFRGVVGNTASDVTTLMMDPMNMTELGVANAASSTEVCPLSSSCARDITGVLSLGPSQGQHLGLEIIIDPNGGTPVLDDWVVTYSCVFDE